MCNNEIVRLPETMHRRGAVYCNVRRGEKTLMYTRVSRGLINSYEVFKIKIRKPTTIKGIALSASETFPHDEAFGKWAKCLTSIERANQVFDEYEK
jgi:hypothetical protein